MRNAITCTGVDTGTNSNQCRRKQLSSASGNPVQAQQQPHLLAAGVPQLAHALHQLLKLALMRARRLLPGRCHVCQAPLQRANLCVARRKGL